MFGTATLTNCTLTANTALGGSSNISVGGGGSGYGGAIFNLDGQLSLTFGTIADNTVSAGAGNPGGNADGGAVYNLAFGNNINTADAMTATATITDSILSNSTGGVDLVNNIVNGSLPNTATLTLNGPNLVITSSGPISGTAPLTGDPQLGPMQDNGGPTPTMALPSSSPASSAGMPVAGVATDQRGQPRPSNSIDLGAFQSLTPQQRFVEALYQDFLHRMGDLGSQSDAGGWVTLLGQGTPAATVASSIARSPEALGVAVDGLYQRFLGRDAAAAEMAGFVGSLENGGTLEGVIQAILGSPEYQSHTTSDTDYVQSLYQGLLHRAGSPAEVNAWVASLPQFGRGGVAQAFLLSQEYRAWEVGDDYAHLLDRMQPPSAVEVATWVSSGLDILTMDAAFAGSPEYQLNG
jgi:hypothetical protein